MISYSLVWQASFIIWMKIYLLVPNAQIQPHLQLLVQHTKTHNGNTPPTSPQVCNSSSNSSSTNQDTSDNPDITSSHPCSAYQRKGRAMYAMPAGNPGKLVMTILQESYWLNDEHMNHAQSLLLKQHPFTKGLHSVLTFNG